MSPPGATAGVLHPVWGVLEGLYDTVMGKKKTAAGGGGGGGGGGDDAGDCGVDWPLTRQSAQAMVALFSKGGTLPASLVEKILSRATEVLLALPTVVDVELKGKATATVCGDTHGQVADVMQIFASVGLPTRERRFVFNGDFVDRGTTGCEVVLLLAAYAVLDPSSVTMLRGNHEDKQVSSLYGFSDEVRRKYGVPMHDRFVRLFAALPLCAVVGGGVVVMHGGLFREAHNLTELAPLSSLRSITAAERSAYETIPACGIICDVLWSDPAPSERADVVAAAPASSSAGGVVGVSENTQRGTGCYFSDEAACAWLDSEGLRMLVRSHEGPDLQPLEAGYSSRADGRVVTVFSARDYGGNGNRGAVVTFGRDCHPKFQSF